MYMYIHKGIEMKQPLFLFICFLFHFISPHNMHIPTVPVVPVHNVVQIRLVHWFSLG